MICSISSISGYKKLKDVLYHLEEQVSVGDLFQLRPVMDNWIFTQSTKGYGPLAANL